MKLELYYLEHCLFCTKVRDFIEKNQLQSYFSYYNTQTSPEASKKLLELNQKTQVPCLVIDGKPMLESNDIIHWIHEHLIENKK